MEVRETAACGISQREFVIEIDPEDLPRIYRILRVAGAGVGRYDEEDMEDVMGQMTYICGQGIEDAPDQDADAEEIFWKEEDGAYQLRFTETSGPRLYEIFKDLQEGSQGYDRALAQRLQNQILEMAPTILENLPVINR